MKPISFIIPAFNCAKTLEATLSSIYDAGNFRDGDEVIVLNDASTDDTLQVAERMRSACPSLVVASHRVNRGGGAARNSAVERAQNELVFCLDSDNILAPETVPKLAEFLLHSNADVASFQQLHYFVESPNEVTHKWTFKEGEIRLADYLAGAVVPGASGNYLYTRASWVKARGYPEFAGALDAWGFGLRQVGTAQKMMVLPGMHYYHRYGHESYWVRESRTGETSLRALQLLIPFIDQLDERDVNRIMGERWRKVWFEQLDKRPIRIKSGQTGMAGSSSQGTSERRNLNALRSLAHKLFATK